MGIQRPVVVLSPGLVTSTLSKYRGVILQIGWGSHSAILGALGLGSEQIDNYLLGVGSEQIDKLYMVHISFDQWSS